MQGAQKSLPFPHFSQLRRVPGEAKDVYNALHYYADANGACYLTLKQLGTNLAMNWSQVKRGVHELRASGVIDWERVGRRNVYDVLHWARAAAPPQSGPRIHVPPNLPVFVGRRLLAENLMFAAVVCYGTARPRAASSSALAPNFADQSSAPAPLGLNTHSAPARSDRAADPYCAFEFKTAAAAETAEAVAAAAAGTGERHAIARNRPRAWKAFKAAGITHPSVQARLVVQFTDEHIEHSVRGFLRENEGHAPNRKLGPGYCVCAIEDNAYGFDPDAAAAQRERDEAAAREAAERARLLAAVEAKDSAARSAAAELLGQLTDEHVEAIAAGVIADATAPAGMRRFLDYARIHDDDRAATYRRRLSQLPIDDLRERVARADPEAALVA